jgi:hypothetical protein
MPPSILLQEEIQQCKVLMRLLAERLGRLEEVLDTVAGADGNKKEDLFLSENGERNKNDFSSLSRNINGNKKAVSSLSENREGNKEITSSLSQNLERNKNELSSLSQNSEGNKEHISSPSHESVGNILGYNRESATALYRVIRKEEKTLTHRQAATNVAWFLLKLLDTPGGHSQQKVAAMFRLSKSGVAKFMMMLFRRGLIERTAYQQYAPSAKAWGYLQQAAEMAAPTPPLHG